MPGPTIGEAVVKVTADTSGVKRDIDQGVTKASENASKAVGGISGSMKGVQAAAGAFLAGAAVNAIGQIGAAIDATVQSFSELEQSMGAVEAVFGKNADEIIRFSEGAAETIGLSQSAAQQAAALLASQLGNFGYSADETTAKVQELLTLASDMSAMFGGTVPEAVAALTSALRGEFNPIERYGVAIRGAQIEQKAMEEGLVDAEGEVTNQGKAMIVLDEITQQTSASHGQFGRELDTVAGKTAVATAKIENMNAATGRSLVPVKNLGTEIKTGFAGAVAVISNSIRALTDEYTLSQTRLDNYELSTGNAAESFQGLTDIIASGKVPFDDLAESLSLTLSQSKPLTEEQKELARQAGLTEDQIRQFDEFLASEHKEAITTSTQDVGENYLAWQDQRGAVAEAEGALSDNTDALQTNIDKLDEWQDKQRAQTDPLFALFDANQAVEEARQAQAASADDVAAAEQNLIDVQKDGKSTQEDIRDAERDLADTRRDAASAPVELAEALQDYFFAQQTARVETDLTNEQLATQLELFGLDREEAKKLADELLAFNDIEIQDIQFGLHIDSNLPSNIVRQILESRPGGVQEEQLGGPVVGGLPYTVGEQGRELFVPNVHGQIVPHARTEQLLAGMGTGGGGGVVINQSFYTEPVPSSATQRAFQEAASVIGIMQ